MFTRFRWLISMLSANPKISSKCETISYILEGRYSSHKQSYIVYYRSETKLNWYKTLKTVILHINQQEQDPVRQNLGQAQIHKPY